MISDLFDVSKQVLYMYIYNMFQREKENSNLNYSCKKDDANLQRKSGRSKLLGKTKKHN